MNNAVLILLQYADAAMCVHTAIEFLQLQTAVGLDTAVPIATALELNLVLSRQLYSVQLSYIRGSSLLPSDLYLIIEQ